jgi:hypothetical protein
MTPYEITSLRTKIENVLEVFNHKLTEGAWMVWADAFRDKDFGHAIKALNEVVRTSKFTPKPADVLGLMGGYKVASRASDSPETYQVASDEVTTAWIMYHRLVYGGDPIIPVKPRVEMTRDRALEIVNEQAAKYDMPDAIMPEYKIDYYWAKH